MYRGLILLLALILTPSVAFAESTRYSYDDVNRVIRVESGKLGITATAGSNGTLSPSGTVIVPYGGSQTFTITPASGYHVTDVKVDGVSVGAVTSYTLSNIRSAHTIEAQFAINTYALNVSLNNAAGGSVTSVPDGISCDPDCTEIYKHGTSVTLNATTDIAYNFSGWSGGCSGTGNCLLTMDSAKNVTANFAIKTFTIATSITGIGGGTISPSGNVIVTYGSDKTFSIGSSIGYTLVDVAADGVSVGPVTSYTFTNVRENHTLSATFHCQNLPVRIPGTPHRFFTSIQEAYNATAEGDTIQVHAVTLTEDLNFNRNISVTIDGGYTCDCEFIPGAENMTTLKGQVQTFPDSGTVTGTNFIVTQ
jgi:hypothetical protein